MVRGSGDQGRYRIAALARGLTVLSGFEGTPLTVSEIAHRTGLQLGTAFRIVATLEEFDFLERLPDGSYQPGIAALKVGNAAMRSSGLLEASERPLRRLADKTGQTVNLGVLTGDRVLYLARLRNADLVTANVRVGSSLPATYTSMGKLLLSFLDDDQIRESLTPASFPTGAGPNARRDVDSLLETLREIRNQGFAIQDEELALGLRSISVAVKQRSGPPIAALNIAVASSFESVEAMIEDFLDPLRQTAAEIAMRLEDE